MPRPLCAICNEPMRRNGRRRNLQQWTCREHQQHVSTPIEVNIRRLNAKLTYEDMYLAHALYKEGLTYAEIAEKFDVSRSTIEESLYMKYERELERIRAATEQLAPIVKRHPAINTIMNQLAKVEAEMTHEMETQHRVLRSTNTQQDENLSAV